MQNNVAEIKIRAERKAGQLLQAMPKNEGQLSRGDTLSPRDDTPTLEDIGITHKQSSRLQAVAAVPEDAFEQHIETVKAGNTDERDAEG